jgi:hypothetical protein
MPVTYTVGVEPCRILSQVTIIHDINAHLEAKISGSYYKELHMCFAATESPRLREPFNVVNHDDTGTTTYYGVEIIYDRGSDSGTHAMRVRAQSEHFDPLAAQRLRKLALLL